MPSLKSKKVGGILLLFFVLLGISLAWSVEGLVQSANSSDRAISYNIAERSQHRIHTLILRHWSNYQVLPAVSGGLQPLEDFVGSENVLAAINGGYFDPVNHKTTSFILEEEQIVADPRFNSRLMDNPDLKSYIPKILNRAEFRTYDCQGKIRYDIQSHSAPLLANCTLKGSLGGGPGLLPENTSVAEGFIDYRDGEKIRDAIGANSLNARSAIGITEEGDLILAMAAQKPEHPLDSGISLTDMADYLSSLGAIKGLNLDGGSSAAFYYGGKIVYGRVDRDGNKIKRPIKSALLVEKQ